MSISKKEEIFWHLGNDYLWDCLRNYDNSLSSISVIRPKKVVIIYGNTETSYDESPSKNTNV